MTLRCKINGNYTTLIQNLKWGDIGSRKCECAFKLSGYLMPNNTWKFSVMCGINNHDMCHKLVGHLIACRLKEEEKEIVFDMTLNMM